MNKRQKRENLAGWILILPQVIGFICFVAFPLGFSLYLCFSEWNFIDPPSWVGTSNIVHIINDPVFWKSVGNTFIYIGICVPCTLVSSLTLAMMTNRKLLLKRFYRAAFFIPMVTSTVAIAMVWVFIYQTQGGILNTILAGLGVQNPPDWLNDSGWARLAVSIVCIWLKVGYYYIIFDAGLKNIPADLYEAADIEGASWWQKFTRITLPMLSPVMFFVTVMLFIDVFNMFNEVYIMTAGGPDYSTYSLSMYIYFYAFNQSDMGRAAVASWFLFGLVGIVTAIEFAFKKKVVYE